MKDPKNSVREEQFGENTEDTNKEVQSDNVLNSSSSSANSEEPAEDDLSSDLKDVGKGDGRAKRRCL